MAFHLCSYWPAADAVEINHGEKGILVGLKAAKTVCERDRLFLLYCSNECASSIRRLAIFTSQSCLEEMCSDGAISLSPERLHSMARAHWLIEWPPPPCTFDPLHQDRSTMTSYSVYYCYLLAEGQRLTLDFMPLLLLMLLFMQLQAQLFFRCRIGLLLHTFRTPKGSRLRLMDHECMSAVAATSAVPPLAARTRVFSGDAAALLTEYSMMKRMTTPTAAAVVGGGSFQAQRSSITEEREREQYHRVHPN